MRYKFKHSLILLGLLLYIPLLILPVKKVKGEFVLSSGEKVSKQQLEKLCTDGTQVHAMLGQSGGYVSNVFKGMVVNGGMNGSDYATIQRWFYSNCPDGW